MKFQNHVNFKSTPQTKAIPGRGDMVKNRAGGYGFEIQDKPFLIRFLVTGAGAGTYTPGNTSDVEEAVTRLMGMIREDGHAVLAETIKFSTEGRGPSNDPALYILALCAAAEDEELRKAALHPNTVSQIARTGTHLFTFLGYLQPIRGWGRSVRRAVAAWYTSKNAQQLTYQVLKYRQRNGWTHRDVLRKAHPVTQNDRVQEIFKYVTDQRNTPAVVKAAAENNPMIAAFEEAQSNNITTKRVIQLVTEHGLPWEFLQTQHLASKDVWSALLPSMNTMALVRNLGRMSANGLITSGSGAAQIVQEKLGNLEALKRSRIHPVAILSALATYNSGRGARGNLTWKPVSSIVDALDGAFYSAFGNVEPTGKSMMLSLDVSGSMDWNYVSSNPVLSCRVAAMAMCMVTAMVEDEYFLNAFSHQMVPVDIDPMDRLDANIQRVHRMPFGGTDCSAPIRYALDNGLAVDTFVIYTDNETWTGTQGHPSQVLQRYRDKTGINAKLVTVAMSGTSRGTIADPKDPGMLDIVGFDTATPNVMSEFSNI